MVVDRRDHAVFRRQRSAHPGLQGTVGGGLRQFGGGIDLEMGRRAVGVLQVQIDIDIVALGENVGRLDRGARRPGTGRLEHGGGRFAGIQPRLIDRQQAWRTEPSGWVALTSICTGTSLPADNGGEVLAGVKIALAEDMAEGDFTRLLRAARVVLELHGDDLAGPGSRWQIRRLEHAAGSGNLYDRGGRVKAGALAGAAALVTGTAAVFDREVVAMVLNTGVSKGLMTSATGPRPRRKHRRSLHKQKVKIRLSCELGQ